jgi:hypothetical protein
VHSPNLISPFLRSQIAPVRLNVIAARLRGHAFVRAELLGNRVRPRAHRCTSDTASLILLTEVHYSPD